LAAPRLVILGRFVWFGAGGLGAFDSGRDVCANDFWAKAGHDRFIAVDDFFEHLGLIAVVLVSVLSLRMQGKKEPHEVFHDWKPFFGQHPAGFVAPDWHVLGHRARR
jgi:hypothetical protein